MLPVPIDFSVAVAARLDERMAEYVLRRWLMLGLALSTILVMMIAVLAIALAYGWPLQLLTNSGSLDAAWAGVTSIGGWLLRGTTAFVVKTGAPTVAAGAGALLVATCGLATAWLWMVSRLLPGGEGQFAAIE